MPKPLIQGLVLAVCLLGAAEKAVVADDFDFGDIRIPLLEPFSLSVPGTTGPSRISTGETDTWTMTITNSGTEDWCDFHVSLVGDPTGIFLGPRGLQITGGEATGFGSPDNSLVLGDQLTTETTVADVVCTPGLYVRPGETFALAFQVTNDSPLIAFDYRPVIQATVPEPPSWFLLLGAGLPLLALARPARRPRPALAAA